jgi:hypothetical protein
MNRYLLAGASALALTVGASAANAQFTFTFSGDATVDFGYSDLTTPTVGNAVGAANVITNDRNTDFTQRTRITLTVQQKTDSGLTYGTATRFRFGGNRTTSAAAPGAGSQSDVDFDRAFIYVNGGFGQVLVGTQYGFYDLNYVSADAWGTGGSDGIWGNFLGGVARGAAAGVNQVIGGNTLAASNLAPFKDLPQSDTANSRVSYTTPDFSGFKAGISYVPTTGSLGRTANLDKNNTTYNDIIEVGASYVATFDAFKVELIGAYTTAAGRPGSAAPATAQLEDLNAYAVSGRFTFGPARLSLHYTNAGESGQTKNDLFKDTSSNVSVFADYAVLPELTVGASWAQYTSPGRTTFAGGQEVTVWAFGAAYTIAPGLSLRPEYVNYKIENKELNQNDYDGNMFFLRTQLVF